MHGYPHVHQITPPAMSAARKSALTDSELWRCLVEAERRKSDGSLPLDVRIRSFETYAICLREADNRGYGYAELKAKAGEQ